MLVTVVLDRGGRAPGLSLACAVVPFQLVTLAVVNAMSSLALRRSIVTNVAFERLLMPLASTCTEAVAFAAALLLPAGLMIVYGVAPTLALVWLVPAIALTFALAVSWAYAAALFGLHHPELRPLGTSVMRALFFLAPGLVALEEIGDATDGWIQLNPLSGLFELWRHAFLGEGVVEVWMVGVPLASAAVVLAVAVPLYRRDAPHFAKVLG